MNGLKKIKTINLCSLISVDAVNWTIRFVLTFTIFLNAQDKKTSRGISYLGGLIVLIWYFQENFQQLDAILSTAPAL